MATKTARVLTAGAAVADFIFHIDEMPRTVEKYRAHDATISGGGNAANAAVAIARLGGNVQIASRTGDDRIADMIIADLQADGVNTDLMHRSPSGKSSFSSIYVDSNGERQIVNFRGNGLAQSTNWLGTLPQFDILLADNRWTPLTRTMIQVARTRDRPAIIDVEAPLEEEALIGATHLAFSAQGLAAYAPGLSTDDALRKSHDQYGAWACVTDGAEGVRSFDGEVFATTKAATITAVETLGAGDVWHGAFALALAEGKGEKDAILFGNAAAALKCACKGGRKSYPTRIETEKFQSETY